MGGAEGDGWEGGGGGVVGGAVEYNKPGIQKWARIRTTIAIAPVRKHGTQRLYVLELGRQASPNHVVRTRHALRTVTCTWAPRASTRG